MDCVVSAPESAAGEQQDRRAVWLLLICVTLWSTSGVLIKESTLPAMAIVGGRSLLTAIVLLLYIRRPRWTWSVAQVGGAVAQAATFVLFVTATQMTSAANAILLQYTAPLWVALFGAWYLHERPRRIDYITMALIAVGMLLFFGDKLTADDLLGNVLAICSGITMAWMTLFLRKQKDGSPFETVLLGNILAAAVGLPFLLTASPTGLDIGILLFLGVFQLGIPFILYGIAIKRLPALEVVLISTLEPILNPLWVFLFNGELPGPMALAGGTIVLFAALLRGLALGARGRLSKRIPIWPTRKARSW
jgi:drug/metabolite transporter (DMT)-like permease